TLVTGYDFTGERKYLERCRRIVEFGRKEQARLKGDFNTVPSSRFQFGIALEGLRRYFEASGDESVLPMIRTALGFLMERGLHFTNCADACGLLYGRTGEKLFLDYGLELIHGTQVFGNPVKDTALNFRNAPYFLAHLAQ